MISAKHILAITAGVLAVCSAVCSHAGRQDEITLLMVPRQEEPVRLGMDIANRFPTLLVSYKVGPNRTVSLHGWTGTQWVNITMDAFRKGDFFRKGPDSALIVEKTGAPVPVELIPPEAWCTIASKITTSEIRPLLHLTGQYYDFSYKDWQWFAKRYNLEMEAINPEELNVAWYHKRMSEHMKVQEQPGTSDLQYWVSIRRPAASAEPQEAASAAESEQPGTEEELQDSPLTNEVPEAVILGAGDAAEETPEAEEAPEVKEEAAEEAPETDSESAEKPAEESAEAPAIDPEEAQDIGKSQ